MSYVHGYYVPAEEIPWIDDTAEGLTVVLPFTDYGAWYTAMTVLLSHEGNEEATPLTLRVEFSYLGSKANERLTQKADVATGEEGSIDIDIPFPTGCRFLRISVISDGTQVPFKWAMLGRGR